MQRYLSLLRRFPLVKRLTWVQLISYFGAWFSNVAIYTLLIELDVSAGVIALVAALHFLPGVVQAPFTGVVIDRVDPKKLMLTLVALQIIMTFSLLLVKDTSMLWLLYVAVIVRMAAASFYFTVEMSLLPKLLDHQALHDANTLHSMIWSASYTLGMALSGFFVMWVGVRMAFIVDGLFFVGAFMILALTIIPGHKPRSKPHFFTDLIEGYNYIIATPKVLSLIVLHAVVGVTAFDALVALLAKHYYAPLLAVPLAIGWLHAVRALALVVGPMILSRYLNDKTLFYLLWFEGVSIITWALFFENFYASVALSFVVGFGVTSLWSYTFTLLQTQTNEAYYGRVISYNDMLFLLVSGTTSLFIGWAFEWGMGLSSITVVLGAVFILMAYYYRVIKKRFLDV